jgi:hypothetical protein
MLIHQRDVIVACALGCTEWDLWLSAGRLLQHMDETPDFSCQDMQILGMRLMGAFGSELSRLLIGG